MNWRGDGCDQREIVDARIGDLDPVGRFAVFIWKAEFRSRHEFGDRNTRLRRDDRQDSEQNQAGEGNNSGSASAR